MKIEIQIDETRVEELAIQEIADRLLNSYSQDSLGTKVKKAMDQAILERLNEVIEEHVQDMLSRPIQTYDTFGNPTGKPLSLSDVLRAGADTYLNQLVKSDGTVSNSQYDTRKTRLHWAVERVALEGLSKYVQDEAKTLKLELQRKATAAAAQLITQIKV